jgi:YebC/PmpR family DNA-binding regulatory protein
MNFIGGSLMSGHSKWSNIKRKKEASDAAKGAVFTKFAKEIAVAVKAGGPDPNSNSRLKVVVAKAKAANMPNDNINRAIKKAAEAGEGDDYEEITYEGYGPAGVAIMVKTLTNNRNRTAADLRHIFDKNGGNLGVDGSVSFLFNEKGTILISKEDYEDEDQVMGDALDSGASDFDSDDEFYIISTTTEDYYDVRDALEAKNYAIADSTLGPVAITTAEVTDPDAVAQLEKMLDMMDENEDIQEVFHNWNG